METLRKRFTWNNPWASYPVGAQIKSVGLISPSMDLSKLPEVGTYALMRLLRAMASSRTRMNLVYTPRLRLMRCSRSLDRKSTRLNSSHLGISYAVFCLKKKKIKQKRNTRVKELDPEYGLSALVHSNALSAIELRCSEIEGSIRFWLAA